jgi:hypothetical protein
MIKSHVLYRLSYGLTFSTAYANAGLGQVYIGPFKKFLRPLGAWAPIA